MSDIFGYNRDPKPQSVFSSENASLTLEGNAEGYMVQQWQVDYQQTVQEIFELGSSNLYWLKGQPQGQGQIGRIVGGSNGGGSGRHQFFDPDSFDLCRGGANMTIEMVNPACDGDGDGSVSMTMSGVVVTSIGYSASVQDLLMRENFGFRFAKMDVS